MENILQIISACSCIYMWFMPFLFVGTIHLIIVNIKKNEPYHIELFLLGLWLFLIIMPIFYCSCYF